MNVKERYLAAYHHQPVDRVPVALSYYHAGFARKHFSPLQEGKDPSEYHIQNQLRYGFDPHVYVRGTAHWQLARPNAGQEPASYDAASGEWRVTERATRDPGDVIRTDYRIETPEENLYVFTNAGRDFGTDAGEL